MGIAEQLAGFGVTFRTMFRKPFTAEYPSKPRVVAPRFHGRHQLNRWPDGLEKCVGCELCAWACPADAIYVEGASNTEDDRYSPGERYGSVYQINYLRCILCGLCIEACPTRALTMTNEFELADDNRADLIYDKNRLLAPLLPGMEEPPHPRRLGDDEQTYFLGLPAMTPPENPGAVGTATNPTPNQGFELGLLGIPKSRATPYTDPNDPNRPSKGDDPLGPPSGGHAGSSASSADHSDEKGDAQ